MSIFRTATKQAILEIIAESAQEGRFGYILTEDGMDQSCERVVDLIEMALELRGRTGLLGMQSSSSQEAAPPARNVAKNKAQPSSTLPRRTGREIKNSPPPENFDSTPERSGQQRPMQSELRDFPRTRGAAEIYDNRAPQNQYKSDSRLPPTQDFKLPRRRVEIISEEKNKFSGR